MHDLTGERQRRGRDRIRRAEAIIDELNYSLDMSHGAIPKQLRSIYLFCKRHLVQASIKKDVAAVVAKPQVSKTMEERGFIPVASTAAQFADIIKSDTIAWQKVIKEANIKPE